MAFTQASCIYYSNMENFQNTKQILLCTFKNLHLMFKRVHLVSETGENHSNNCRRANSFVNGFLVFYVRKYCESGTIHCHYLKTVIQKTRVRMHEIPIYKNKKITKYLYM